VEFISILFEVYKIKKECRLPNIMENLKALKGLYRGEKKKQNPVMSWCSNAIRNHS